MESNLPQNISGLDEYIDALVHDSRTLMQDLYNSKSKNFDVIEIYADIPERQDFDYFISLVERWEDVSRQYNKPIRIYTYLHNIESEKYIQKLLANRKNLFITVLPHYIRKRVNKNERYSW